MTQTKDPWTDDGIGPIGPLCGTHGWANGRAWHHDYKLDRKVWTPARAPRIVAECWTCAYGKHGSDFPGGEEGKPRQLRDLINAANHRAAGHDVRDHDARYDYVACAGCGETYQRIDFRGNPHAAICHDVREVPNGR